MAEPRVTIPAYAKVNLALSVGPPQPPRGYHPIASWFSCISLRDEVEIERLPHGSGPVSGASVVWAEDAPLPSEIDWPIEKDLAVRAHALMEHAAGRALPVHLSVRKRIPVGGGLGGGSADAAAVIVGLDRLFELDMPRESLKALGMRLGSDIAFFIDDETAGEGPARPAVVGGFGERVRRIGHAHAELVLVFPPFGCATSDVYRAFDGLPETRLRAAEVDRIAEEAEELRRIEPSRLFNDLAEPACRVQPRLAELLGRFREAGLPRVHVTGSGSTMFIVVEPEMESAKLTTTVMTAAPEVRAMAARLV